MAQEIKMSAAGLKAMQEELEYLKTVRRKELAEEIKEARSHGDLSENRETGEDEAEEYDIVGRTEADAFNGKISDESPVGHALMGKAVGEKVEVLLPTGQTVEYTVLAITHSAN